MVLILVITISAGAGAMAIQAEKQDISTASVFCNYAVRIALYSKVHRTEKRSLALIEKAGRTNKNFSVSEVYQTIYGFNTEYIEETEVCIFGEEDAQTFIYYLHGGGFIYQPTGFHYRYCRLLSKQLNARIIMPIYPKAPQYTYQYTLDTIYSIYNRVTSDTNYNSTVIMGDSAGGSLTLTLGQYILENGGKQPDDLIALSPCLDMSLSNPQIASYEKIDPMLSLNDLKLKLDVYFLGETDAQSYKVSPIYCDYATLPEVTIFMGTDELLLPDARLLKSRLDEEGVNINYYEYGNMCHTFPLFPTPEAKQVMGQIEDVIR